MGSGSGRCGSTSRSASAPAPAPVPVPAPAPVRASASASGSALVRRGSRAGIASHRVASHRIASSVCCPSAPRSLAGWLAACPSWWWWWWAGGWRLAAGGWLLAAVRASVVMWEIRPGLVQIPHKVESLRMPAASPLSTPHPSLHDRPG